MDRVIVYPGQIPLDTDFLQAQRFAQIGVAKNSETVLGTNTIVDGFACIPTVPASLSVQVEAGTIYGQLPLEASSYGTLAADVTHSLLKQGVALDAATFTVVPPATAGHATNYLIQVGLIETDEVPIVLPYYNSANPSQPYSGPENSGGPQYTRRNVKAVVSAKAGASATAGSQTTPAADPGYVPLYVITVAQGATSITSVNIAKHASAPFLIAKLPEIPHGVQDGRWIYAEDQGSANSIIIEPTPMPTALVAGMGFRVKVAAVPTDAVTVSVGALGAVPLYRSSTGAAVTTGGLRIGQIIHIVFDGSAFQLVSANATFDVESVGSGNVDVYEGASGGTHFIRSLIEGSNITLEEVADGETGHKAIRINAAGGGGGGSVLIENVGDGAQVYKGNDGTNEEFRTIKGGAGVTVTQNADDATIKLADALAWAVMVRNGGTNGAPAGVPIGSLTAEANPALADKLMLAKSGTNALRSVTIQSVLAASGSAFSGSGVGALIWAQNSYGYHPRGSTSDGATLINEAAGPYGLTGTWMALSTDATGYQGALYIRIS